MPSIAAPELKLTMLPPAAFRCGSASDIVVNMPTTLTSSSRRRSSTLSFSSGPPPVPAYARFTIPSRRPNSETARSIAACTCSASVTSHAAARPAAFRSLISAATEIAFSWFQSPTTTAAPSDAITREQALPIPRPPPKVITTLPSSRPVGAMGVHATEGHATPAIGRR